MQQCSKSRSRPAHSRSLIAAVTALSATSLALSDASITLVPLLPTGGYSYPSALTADGTMVVGQATVGSAGNWRGFRWRPLTGQLDALVPAGGLANALATDVSDAGIVVGKSWPTFWGDIPTAWSTTGAVTSLTLPSNGYWGVAATVSHTGSTIFGTAGSPGFSTGVSWSDASSPVAFIGGAELRATNSDGSVAVGKLGWSGASRAFRWTAATGVVDLGVLAGTAESAALDVCGDGSVVVGYSYTLGAAYKSFRWSQSAGMVHLGDLPGSTRSVAVATSADGLNIVGYTIEGDAFLWKPTTGSRKLLDVLTDLGADTAGWTRLTQPSGISANGRFVIGYGDYQGATRGFYADLGACSTLVSRNSGELGGISAGASREFNFTNLNPASGDGRLSIRVRGDLGLKSEYLTIQLDGQNYSTVFATDGSVCTDPPREAEVDIPQTDLANLLADGVLHVRVEASEEVGVCSEGSCTLTLSYQPVTTDCDGNGVPDPCDIRVGAGDCDLDGVLDYCEIASGSVTDFDQTGVPDSCECLADLFVDGHVNGADLGIALSQWGQGAGAAADINRDGVVNGADLSILLSSWGACP